MLHSHRRRIVQLAVGILLLTAASQSGWAQVIDHYGGFAPSPDLTFNGNAGIVGTVGRLTAATNNQAGSIFSTAQVPIGIFQTSFTFHTVGTPNSMADGMGFCIQRDPRNATALGANGGSMAYGGVAGTNIVNSVYVAFDNYPGTTSSTNFFTGGVTPADGPIDLRPTIDFQTGRDFSVFMNYDGTTLSVTITDTTNGNVLSQAYTQNIPTLVGGATAHIGFTGATGGLNARQEVVNWAYSTTLRPTNLVATPAVNRVNLTWTAVAGATSYNVYRSTTAGGPYSRGRTHPGGLKGHRGAEDQSR